MPIARAGLLAKIAMPEALAALAEAAEWLHARGCTPVVDADAAEAGGFGGRWTTAVRADLPGMADVLVVFGGDGTLLEAASLVAHSPHDVPLVGINLGRLGFLTDVSRGDMLAGLEGLISGRTQTDSRLLLGGRVVRSGQVVHERLALNDIVITRAALSRMIELDVSADGHPVCHVKADGLIIATATGSTAYNLSAGGPIVHPLVDAVVLTPIAPHTLTNRPLVLPADLALALRPVPDPQADLVVTFDGQSGAPLGPDDVVEVARAPRLIRLMHTSPRTHFDMLREKLQWGR